MKFKATIEQIESIALNAINASTPAGLGHLHFTDGDYSKNDIQMATLDKVDMDYVGGRMVKLSMFKKDDFWHIPNGSICNPDNAYQSWCSKYPTYRSLIMSAGVKIEDIVMEE
jgi:hypothetical protein